MSIEQVERVVSGKIAIYGDELEVWQKDYAMAQLCFDLEDLMQDGVNLFEDVLRLDECWRDSMDGGLPYAKEFDVKLTNLAIDLARNMTSIESQLLPQFEGDFGSLSGAGQFKEACKKIRAIVTPDSKHFVDEKLFELGDKAVLENKEGRTIDFDFPKECSN